MSNQELRAATGLATKKSEAVTFPQLLERMKPEIARALPGHLKADRMCRIALTEFRKNPALAQCNPQSIIACIVVASQLGLEPGVLGQAYLVPFKGECQLIPGWQGYVDLVNRAGRASVWTNAVRVNDHFEFQAGSHPGIDHVPSPDDDESEFTYCYAVGWVRDALHPVIEVWSRAKILNHLKRNNRVGGRHYALQNENNLEMYGRKVALLQVLKYMPKSTEMATATGLEYAANDGSQGLTLESATDGTWTPPALEQTPEAAEGHPDVIPEDDVKPAPDPWENEVERKRISGTDDAAAYNKVLDLARILGVDRKRKALLIRTHKSYASILAELEKELPAEE